MTANVLFYAVASVLTVRIKDQSAVTAAVIAVLSFAALVLFGEILPKSVAYANSKSLSTAAAAPAFLCLKIFAPPWKGLSPRDGLQLLTPLLITRSVAA